MDIRMVPVIYHNPRCAKSRATLKLIQEGGHQPDVVEYLKEPPSPKELDQLSRMLGMEPVELIRSKEKILKELGVSVKDDRPRAEWLALMSKHPILIERPIVVVGKKAVLGRPPENVKALL